METLWLTIGFLGFVAATVFFLFLMTRAPAGSQQALGEAARVGGQAQTSRVR